MESLYFSLMRRYILSREAYLIFDSPPSLSPKPKIWGFSISLWSLMSQFAYCLRSEEKWNGDSRNCCSMCGQSSLQICRFDLYSSTENVAKDLELFAHHAGRKVVNMNDVVLSGIFYQSLECKTYELIRIVYNISNKSIFGV
ncbi:hypothetical protein N665_0072s0043 [Sinapis alba]|nr:hypothetical protein N665_0072s0043 [Sinapis alba]